MSESLQSVGAITLFVEDVQRAKSFYEEVFDQPAVVFEDENSAAFRFQNMIVNLLATPEAHGLIEPATVAGPDAGSRFQLSIWVKDADAVCAELEKKGVKLINGPVDREWGMRTAAFADPSGHIWEIAQELSNGSAT